VGRYVATHSNRLQGDTDEELARSAGAATPRDVYRNYGKETFAEMETAALETLISRAKRAEREMVVATGGGICDNEQAFDLLTHQTTIVFLDAPTDLLYARFSTHGAPAFLDPARPYDHFVELAAQRRKRYGSVATYHVDATLLNVAQIGDVILELFG